MTPENAPDLSIGLQHHIDSVEIAIKADFSAQLISQAMALQSCRPSLARCRHTARAFTPCARTFATESESALSTPESFKIPATPANNTKTKPRWSQTPQGMKAPLQLDFAKSARNKIWAVNNDPTRLDEVYNRLLGPGGSKMLPEELKWLAVTHKSFDQGRRGFNDRLALLGWLSRPIFGREKAYMC